MFGRTKKFLAILFSAAFLLAGWGAVSPVLAAPMCMGCDGDMSGMDMSGGDQQDPIKSKSNSECMVKAGCYATCAKLPTRNMSSSHPAFVRLAFTLQLIERFETLAPAPELSPPKIAA